MDKSQITRGLIRLCAVAAQAGVVVLASSVLLLPISQARETYAAYADRIVQNPPDGAEVRPDLEMAVLTLTNSYRASRKLPPLKPADAVLLKAARAQALDLLSQGAMGHVASTGQDFAGRMRALHPGQMFLPVMAENAARVRKSELPDMEKAKALVEQWIGSPSHRKNMANRSYMLMAVGVVTRGKVTYAVQIFSGPAVKTNMGLVIQQ